MTQKQIEKWERDAERVMKRALEVEKAEEKVELTVGDTLADSTPLEVAMIAALQRSQEEAERKDPELAAYIARRRAEITDPDEMRLSLGIL